MEEIFLLGRHGELEGQKGLEDGEDEQGYAGAYEPAGGVAPSLERGAFLGVYLAEGHDRVPELERIPVLDGLEDVYLVAVHIGPLAGAQVGEGPVSVSVALERGVQL